MSELKTQPTRRSATKLINDISQPVKRADCLTLLELFERLTGEKPVVWGQKANPFGGIIGFGRYRYRYKSGQQGIWPLTGFSPRKQNIAIYIMPGFDEYQKQLANLGPHRHSVSCLYINRLATIDLTALESIIAESVATMRERYST